MSGGYHRAQSSPGLVPRRAGASLASGDPGAVMSDQVQCFDMNAVDPPSGRRTSNYELHAGGGPSRVSSLLSSTGGVGTLRVSLTSRPCSPFQQLRGSSDFGARRPEQQYSSAAGQSHPRQSSLRRNGSSASGLTQALASTLYLEEADELGSVASAGGDGSVVGRSEYDEDTSGSQVLLPVRMFTDDFSCRGGNWSSRGSVTTATASSPYPTVASSSHALVMRHDQLIKLLATPSDKVGDAALFGRLPFHHIPSCSNPNVGFIPACPNHIA